MHDEDFCRIADLVREVVREELAVITTKTRRPKFIPPTRDEWLTYADEAHPNWPQEDATKAWSHYESVGWTRGKNRTPVVNWKACMATCIRRSGGGKYDGAF